MIKIVTDSSANLFDLPGAEFQSVPLKINAGEREFEDIPALDVPEMVEYLRHHKGKSGTSCPNFQEWFDAFRGADQVFAMTITGKMSGSYNSAVQAAQEYMEEHPGQEICVLDSRSAGPGMELLLEKLQEYISAGMDFADIREAYAHYRKHTHLVFSLESLHNLAQNGRCSHTVARLAGVLGIRLVGDELDGELHPLHKCRGEKKTLDTIFAQMEEQGLQNGCRVRIAHCFNPEAAENIKDRILDKYPDCSVHIRKTTGLCSFYAEHGGLMVGFEDGNA